MHEDWSQPAQFHGMWTVQFVIISVWFQIGLRKMTSMKYNATHLKLQPVWQEQSQLIQVHGIYPIFNCSSPKHPLTLTITLKRGLWHWLSVCWKPDHGEINLQRISSLSSHPSIAGGFEPFFPIFQSDSFPQFNLTRTILSDLFVKLIFYPNEYPQIFWWNFCRKIEAQAEKSYRGTTGLSEDVLAPDIQG
jgi:hypothetical protein